VKILSGFEQRRARIEMVALMDVMFLLLVFFIYAVLSLSSPRAIDVSLPRGTGEAAPASVLVVIERSGAVSVDGTTLGLEEAARRAAEHAAVRIGSPRRPVLIRGDRAAALGRAVELLDRLRAAGVASVAFEVEEAP
jgi:biopolymer transport protein ExbD